MRKVLLLILLFISFGLYGQLSYWRLENAVTDDMGNHDLVIKDGATFSNTEKIEGSYGGNFDNTYKNRMVTADKIDMTTGGWTVNFACKFYGSSGSGVAFSNATGGSTKGISIHLDYVNKRVGVYSNNGSSSKWIYSENNALVTGVTGWNYVSVRFYDINGYYAKIYVGGALSLASNDSTIVNGCGVNDTVSIGGLRNALNGLFGYMDNVSLYNCALSTDSIVHLYDNRTANHTVDCESAPVPPASGATARWLFNNDWMDEEGNYNLIIESYMGGFRSSSPSPVEGLYYVDFADIGNQCVNTLVPVDLSTGGMTLAFNIYNTGDGSSEGVVFTNYGIDGNASSVVVGLDNTNNRIQITNYDAVGNPGQSVSADNSVPVGSWTHITVRYYDVTAANVTIWINGVKDQTDSVTIAGAGKSDSIYVGAFYNGTSSLDDYLDNMHLYDFAATDAQIMALYLNRGNSDYALEEGEDVGPITYGAKVPFYGQTPRKMYYSMNRNRVLKGWVTSPGVADDYYEDIVHYQTAICPSDAVAGDYVVELAYNRNWSETNEDLVYVKTGGSDYFNIVNGVVTVVSVPPSGIYHTVQYSVSDGVFTDTARVDISVVPYALCIYIDPTWSGTQLGTRAYPYKTMPAINQANYNYLLKRNTLYTQNYYETIDASSITLGAYGVGPRPVLANSYPNNTGIGCINITSKTNVTIRDIHFYDYGTMIAIIRASSCTNLTLDNLIVRGTASAWGGGTFDGIRCDNITDGGIYNSEIYNIYANGVIMFGCKGNSTADRFMWEGNYVHHINLGFDAAKSLGGVGINRQSDGDGLYVIGIDPYGAGGETHYDNRYNHFRYNRVDMTNQPWKHGINYGMCDIGQNSCGTIIEYNYFDNYAGWNAYYGQNGISVYNSYGIIVRYNEMWNSTDGVFTPSIWAAVTLESGGRRMQIYGNLIYQPKRRGIGLEHNCDSSLVYNNTIVKHSCGNNSPADKGGVWLHSTCYGTVIENNIFQTDSTGSYVYPVNGTPMTEDYNWFDPDNGAMLSIGGNSAEGSAGFVTGNHSAYEINSSSGPYHQGTPVGITYDFWGRPYNVTTPSQGYKEYLTP